MTDVAVRSEPRTYRRGGEFSYLSDLMALAMPGSQYHGDAKRRLERHAGEVRTDATGNSPEAVRLARSLQTESRSGQRGELRAMTDTTAGVFTVPEYLVEDTVPYRTYGRAFADQCNLHPLGGTGMTVYIPAVGAAAQVATQTAETGGFSEVDPTGSYLSGAVKTAVGQITASQQLLDRQQDGTADTAMQAQLTMAYNTNLDASVIAAAVAAGGTGVTDSGTQSIPNLWLDVSKAQAQMLTAPGTVLPATHTFFPVLNWAWLAAQVDSQNRPIILPTAPYIPADGHGDEGDCDFVLIGTRSFRDGNIPAAGGNAQLLVCHMPEVWLFESEPIMRSFVETHGRSLAVVVQRYSYWTCIVRYQQAVQTVTGAAYPLNPTV